MNVQLLIQDHANQLFINNPDKFPLTKLGHPMPRAIKEIFRLSEYLYNSRSEEEIIRDYKLNITIHDYNWFVLEAFFYYLKSN